jgi:hypothetical protein
VIDIAQGYFAPEKLWNKTAVSSLTGRTSKGFPMRDGLLCSHVAALLKESEHVHEFAERFSA